MAPFAEGLAERLQGVPNSHNFHQLLSVLRGAESSKAFPVQVFPTRYLNILCSLIRDVIAETQE